MFIQCHGCGRLVLITARVIECPDCKAELRVPGDVPEQVWTRADEEQCSAIADYFEGTLTNDD